MPPKKNASAAATATESDGGDEGMSRDEQKFLIDCLMCPSAGSFTVDAQAVADRRGQKNAKSIMNRISTMRKKYNLSIGTGAGGGKASDAAGPNQPAVPATPSKARVSKAKKGGAKKGGKKQAKEEKLESSSEEDTKMDVKDESEGEGEEAASEENEHEDESDNDEA